MKPTALVIEDDLRLRETVAEILRKEGFEVLEAGSGREAEDTLKQRRPDIALCDWKMPDGDGRSVLEHLQQQDLLRVMPVVVMTAHSTSQNAIDAMQIGAYDFLAKPLDLDELRVTAQRALQHARLQQEVEELRGKVRESNHHEHPPMIGSSRPMLETFKSIGRVARTDTAVLILGESGTGKELVARCIHENSGRKEKPFVVVNCAALPADLLEAELFGHEKGAFTGAVAKKPGRFEAAAGGTVFLDEIGELPIAVQPKLLRILQEHTFERVGGNATLQADFRLIAATNRDLENEARLGTFRQDLYFRLSVFTVELPPLRSRRSDIVPLAEHFLAKFSERNGFPVSGFSEDAILKLQQYEYPGNVRELEHVVEAAVLLAQGRVVNPEHLRFANTDGSSGSDDLSRYLRMPFHESVGAWEKLLVQQALQHAGGNKAEAARALGIQRRLLYEKLKQHNLE